MKPLQADALESAWQPRCLLPAPTQSLNVRARLLILFAVVALHGIALWYLYGYSADEPEATQLESMLQINFISRPQPVVRPNSTVPAKSSKAQHHLQPNSTDNLQHVPQKPALPLVLYNIDGRLALPDGLLDRLDDKFSDQRIFEYQVRGLDKVGVFRDHPRALVFESTRFDQYWQPDQDLLTELLAEAVEKSSSEIHIPIPGNPKAKIVCRISLVALAGSCGVVGNGDGYVFRGDDPDTLSAEENRQCQAWWQLIIGAQSQEIWRQTRKLYEAQCRKPLQSPK